MDDLISRQSAQPERKTGRWTLLKKAKFEYDEAWRIIAHPTPDVTYADKNRARIILDTFKDSLGMLNELPSVQPDTTTHDSNVVKKGGNDEDRTSGDCISRQRSVDTLRKMQTYKLFSGDDMLLIDQAEAQTELMMLPPAQPVQRWIPISEKLPEDHVDVIVWFEYFRFGNYNRLYQTWGIGDYSEKYGSWMVNHESGWHKLRVIAWMPLPEPYQGGGE